jgi:hypothetical protein
MQSNLDEGSFQKSIAELKSFLYKIKKELDTEEQRIQAEQIIQYRVMSQRTAIERFLLRHFLGSRKFGFFGSTWKTKGIYLFDLERIELKLGGLIYKIEEDAQK